MSTIRLLVRQTASLLPVLALVTVPGAALATSGSGGEDVQPCPPNPPVYQPAPYQGAVALQDGLGVIVVSTPTPIPQVGGSGCTVRFVEPVAVPATISAADVTPRNLQGACVTATFEGPDPVACSGAGFVLEVLGAGNKQEVVPGTFTIDVILMRRTSL